MYCECLQQNSKRGLNTAASRFQWKEPSERPSLASCPLIGAPIKTRKRHHAVENHVAEIGAVSATVQSRTNRLNCAIRGAIRATVDHYYRLFYVLPSMCDHGRAEKLHAWKCYCVYPTGSGENIALNVKVSRQIFYFECVSKRLSAYKTTQPFEENPTLSHLTENSAFLLTPCSNAGKKGYCWI